VTLHKHVVHATGEGLNALGVVRNVRRLVDAAELFRYRHPQRDRDGKVWSQEIRHWTIDRDSGRRTLNWTLRLPLITGAAGEMALKEAVEHHAFLQPKPTTEADPPAIVRAKRRALSKGYRDTIHLMDLASTTRDQDRQRLAASIFRAFVLETFVMTGVALDRVHPGEMRKLARMAEAASKRKGPALDALDHELVNGWIPKGYMRMRPEDLQACVLRATGTAYSVETIRKRAQRLSLPTFRLPGRPNK